MISFDDFKKMELKIARIVAVDDHPNADKLLLLKINTGDRDKQIVAGIKIRPYRPIWDLNHFESPIANCRI